MKNQRYEPKIYNQKGNGGSIHVTPGIYIAKGKKYLVK